MQRSVLLEYFLKCKLYFKKSIKLIKIINLLRPGEDFFRQPHIRNKSIFLALGEIWHTENYIIRLPVSKTRSKSEHRRDVHLLHPKIVYDIQFIFFDNDF